tara:strand:- start:437 stop:634 length:198 start_codon:yes stop_codon:yes gene_type:complete
MQFDDDTTVDGVIKSKIKKYQLENNHCTTSRKLRTFYEDKKINHIFWRLTKPRQWGNEYQEQFSL